MDQPNQIAQQIFTTNLSIMKNILDIEEFRIGSRNEQFRYFKKQIMNEIYEGTLKIFHSYADDGLLDPCECGANLRQGWSNCPKCSGCGFKNSERLNDII